jgi:hypothetical protein
MRGEQVHGHLQSRLFRANTAPSSVSSRPVRRIADVHSAIPPRRACSVLTNAGASIRDKAAAGVEQ